MTRLEAWLDAYSVSHRNPTNKRIHWVCIPLIVVALLALLSQWHVPGQPWLSAASVVVVGAPIYYFRLSRPLAWGMLLVVALSALCVAALRALPIELHWSAGALFVLGWAGQFYGHQVEGRKPSFFQDIQFLLIGPLWLLAAVYRRFQIEY